MGDFPDTGADVWFFYKSSAVGIGASHAAVELAGHGCFGISGVGACVFVPVFEHKREGTETRGEEDDEQSGDSGRKVIGNIIHSGGKAAKFPETIVFISHHGIEGVNHFVAHHERSSSQGKVKDGGNDTVAQVLCQGFQGGDPDLRGGKVLGIPPDNPTELFPGGGQISGLEFSLYPKCFLNQGMIADPEEKDKAGEYKTAYRERG